MLERMKRIVAGRVQQARKASGLTQKELAERLGVSPQRVSEIEAGDHSPQLDTLVEIANVLDMKLNLNFEPDNLEDLDHDARVSRTFTLPVGLLKRCERQARTELESTNEYVLNSLNEHLKREYSNHFYRRVSERTEAIEVEESGEEPVQASSLYTAANNSDDTEVVDYIA